MTMLLSENAENEYTALIHELGEFGLSYNRTDMKQVQESIIHWWAEKNGVKGFEDFETLAKNYQKVYAKAEGSKTTSQAIDEMINDALGGLFSTETGAEQFVQWLQKESGYNQTEQRTIIQRIVDTIDNVVKYLKKLIKDSSLSRAARETAQMEEQRANEIRQMFLNVLEGAIETANTTGEYTTDVETKFQLKGIDEQGIEVYETSDATKKMKYSERKALLLNLMKNEFAGRTAKFNKNSQVYYALYDEAGVRKGIYGDNKSDKKGFNAKVNIGADGNYIELVENARYYGTSQEQGKKNKFHRDAKSWDYYVKTIKSDGVYFDVLINVKDTGNDQYVYNVQLNENKATLSHALKHLKSKEAASDDIVSDTRENATHEMKYSLKFEIDSEGNRLSEQQREYFKDSKVRDESGNLKVMHHGMMNDFTVFNPFIEGGKNGVQEGYGIYFTDAEQVTESYGNKKMTGYLNITRPATSFKKTIKSAELVKLIKATAEAEARRYVEDGDYDDIEDALKDTWISNYTDTYSTTLSSAYKEVASEILSSESDDMSVVQEIMRGIAVRDYQEAYEFYDILKNTMGIDGFVTEWNREHFPNGKAQIAVAFDSHQFKNMDNMNPTDNEDIRYSLKVDIDENISYDSLKNKSNMPISRITTDVEEVRHSTRKQIVERAIDNLERKGLRDSDNVIRVHNDDTGLDIVVGKAGLNHGLDRNYEDTALVSLHLDSYLKHAIKINEVTPGDARRHESMILLGYGENQSGESIPAYFVVSKLATGMQELVEFASLYSVRAKKITEDSALSSRGFQSSTSVEISIADLLNLVKNSYSDVLPKDVAEQYGVERRKTKLGENVKYSLREDYDALEERYRNTLRENDTYKTIIDSLESKLNIQKGISVSKESAEKAADKIYRRYKSTYDKADFTDKVAGLFQSGEINKGNFLYIAEQIMRPVIENSKNNLEISDYAKGILKDIRKTPIKLDGMQRNEAAYHHGTFNDYRKVLFGRATFTDKGTSLDILWKQWSEAYPEWFDESISPVDQPIKLAEIINSLKEDYSNEYGFSLDDAVSYAAMELMNEYANIPEVKSMTDKAASAQY